MFEYFVKPKNILKVILTIAALWLVYAVIHTTFSSYVELSEEYDIQYEEFQASDGVELLNEIEIDGLIEPEYLEYIDVTEILDESEYTPDETGIEEAEEAELSEEFEVNTDVDLEDDSDAVTLENGIRGVVWIDESGDGEKEDDAHVVIGVMVRLYDVSNGIEFVTEVETNEQGVFVFEALTGEYIIRLESDVMELDQEDQEDIPVAEEGSDQSIDFSNYEGIAELYIGIQPFNVNVSNLMQLRQQINSRAGNTTPFVINLNFTGQAVTSTAPGDGTIIAPNQGNVITIPANTNIILQSATGRQTWNQHTPNQRHFIVEQGATLTLNNVSLSRTTAFAGNSTSSGGVDIEGGTMIMNNGSEISRNHRPNTANDPAGTFGPSNINDWGAGVRVGAIGSGGLGTNSPGGTLIMNDGAIISHNRSTTGPNNGVPVGGGVAVIGANARFEMNGGTISHNTSLYTAAANLWIGNGGGVAVHYGAMFEMRGGLITENEANNGGGVAVGNMVSSSLTHPFPRSHIYMNVPAGRSAIIYNNSARPFSGAAAGGGGGGGVVVQNGYLTMGGPGEKHIIDNNAVTGGGINVIGTVWSADGHGIVNMGTTGVRNISYNRATGAGGGVHITSAGAHPAGGIPVAIASGGRFYMPGGTITNNEAGTTGGGVHITNAAGWSVDMAGATEAEIDTRASTFNMSGGTISDNEAGTHGGGVNAIEMARFNMSGDADISDNQAGTTGGGAHIAQMARFNMSGNATIYQNEASTHGGGAAILNTARLNMSGNADISDNEATLAGGGAAIFNDARLNMSDDSTIYDNDAISWGGGVAALENSRLTMSGNSRIYENTAHTASAGGVGGTGNATIEMESGSIDNNDSETHGGGVAMSGTVTFNMRSGSIADNEAGTHGGGVSIAGTANFNMYGTSIINRNIATTSGGGVNTTGGTFTMNSGTIGGTNATDRNQAVNGGGVHMTGGTFIMGTATNSANITRNTASNTGGGVHLNSANATFTFNNGTIGTNTATNHGGGIYITGGEVDNYSTFTMNGGSIYDNDAGVSGGGGIVTQFARFNMLNGDISNNESAVGGGIFVAFSARFNMSGNSTIYNNDATSWGGGIIADGNSRLTISGNSSISENTALGFSGGGVTGIGNATIEMEGGSIDNNESTTNGGGVNISGTATLNMRSGSIADNEAGTHGGGVSIAGTANFNMYGTSTINRNIATTSGGGVHINSSNATFTFNNGTIGTNTATNHGGGVYITGGTSFDMIAGSGTRVIENNEATSGGGVYINNGTFNLNGLVDNNRALGPATNVGLETGPGGEGHGGGIFAATNGTVNAQSGSITNNSAVGDGGGIFTEVRRYQPLLQSGDYGNLTIQGTTFASNTSVEHFPRPDNANATFITARIPYNTSHSVRDHVLNNHDINFRRTVDPEIEKTVYVVTGTGTRGANVEDQTVRIEQYLEYVITVTNPNISEALQNFMVVDEIPDYLRIMGAPTPSISVQRRNAIGELDNVSGASAAYVNYTVGVSAEDHENGEVRVIFPTLSADGEYVITFRVRVLSDGAGETIINTARLHRHNPGTPITGQPGDQVDYDTATIDVEDVADFEFIKVEDDTTTPLPGAIFSLYRRNADGTWPTTPITSGITSSNVTGSIGLVRFEGLIRGGTYRLVETYAPGVFQTPPTGTYWLITVGTDGTISTPVRSGTNIPNFILRGGNFYLPNERAFVPPTGLFDNSDHYISLVLGASLVALLAIYYKIWKRRRQF